jgi:predicted O-methyltransferase YrrM
MSPEESVAWHSAHPGGSTDILPWLADVALPRTQQGGTYLEIGSFFGRSISFVGVTRPDLSLIAIDPWTNEWDDAGERLPVGPYRELRDRFGGMYEAWCGMLDEHAPDVRERVLAIRKPSAEGMLELDDESVDLILVDGDHKKEGVIADIQASLRVCKTGGIIGFHDCGWRGPVYQAVSELLPAAKFAPWPVDREGWEPGCSSVMWIVRA